MQCQWRSYRLRPMQSSARVRLAPHSSRAQAAAIAAASRRLPASSTCRPSHSCRNSSLPGGVGGRSFLSSFSASCHPPSPPSAEYRSPTSSRLGRRAVLKGTPSSAARARVRSLLLLGRAGGERVADEVGVARGRAGARRDEGGEGGGAVEIECSVTTAAGLGVEGERADEVPC